MGSVSLYHHEGVWARAHCTARAGFCGWLSKGGLKELLPQEKNLSLWSLLAVPGGLALWPWLICMGYSAPHGHLL